MGRPCWRSALFSVCIAAGRADRPITYDVFKSRCPEVPLGKFMQQGCLGGTMQSWSYGMFRLNVTAPAGLASGGAFAMAVKPDWSTALWLHGSLIFVYGDLAELRMQLYNSGNIPTKVRLTLCGGDASSPVGAEVETDDLPPRSWVTISYPFSRFSQGGSPISASQQINAMKVVATPLSGSTEWVYVTEVAVVGMMRSIDTATARVDWSQTGRVVSPMLFGVNMAAESTGGYTSNRWGGNAVTRYAWDIDVQNRARDWFFENIPNEADQVEAPSTSASDRLIETTLAASAASVITIPTLGFVPIDREQRCGFSVAKYGAQNSTDRYSPDCGNGLRPDGFTPITGNDASDTSRTVGPEYAVAWLNHLATRHGADWLERSWFALDNEPNYWADTHRDVHPQPHTYAELWSYTLAYSLALRAAYPKLRLAGPDYTGFQALSDPVEREQGGSLPFMEAFVSDLGEYERSHGGTRLLDVLDIHCYPEGEWDASHLDPAADHIMRMRLTRELWDESFYIESWLARPAFYLRWARQLIATHAPWLNLSCTEWNYQKDFKDDDIVGAVISVDAIGIYAREGVDLANKWSSPEPGSVIDYALLHFLHNFDGEGSSIAGATYVEVHTSSDQVGAHGFLSSDGQRVHVLLICRQYEGEVRVEVPIPEEDVRYQSELVSVYRLDAQHIVPSSPESIAPKSGKIVVTMPPASAVLIVANKKAVGPMSPAPPPSPPPPPLHSPPPPSKSPPPPLKSPEYAHPPPHPLPPLDDPRLQRPATDVISATAFVLTEDMQDPLSKAIVGSRFAAPPSASASVAAPLAAPLTLSVGIVAVIFFALCAWVSRRVRLPTYCFPLGFRKQRTRIRDDDDDAVSMPQQRSSRSRSDDLEECVPSVAEDGPDGASNLLSRRVCLQGLSKTALNGSGGTAVSFDSEAERMLVTLDSGGSVKVKLINLQLADSEEALVFLGNRVCLHGLSTEALNGKCGTAIHFDDTIGRVVVNLEGKDSRTVKVKLQNLKLANSRSRRSSKVKVDPRKKGRSYEQASDDESSAINI
mmetsp:Transcript_73021/g.176195  ORF Transcript_73021/g.176195 Transcript_73021/m.176195 type:complete len:1040 (-) Transcript_73021:99-3218(-)